MSLSHLEVTATIILRFASHAFSLLRFWNQVRTVTLHIVPDVSEMKSYLLFPSVLMKYIHCHINSMGIKSSPYQPRYIEKNIKTIAY
jgi:hypothetical protein